MGIIAGFPEPSDVSAAAADDTFWQDAMYRLVGILLPQATVGGHFFYYV